MPFAQASPWSRPAMSDKRRALFIMSIPLLIIAAGLAWWRVNASESAIDVDLCLKSAPLVGSSVLLVDRTDAITPGQKQYLHEALRRIVDGLAPNERLSIYAITGTSAAAPTPLFSRCNPGTSATTNILTRSPEKVQAEFERMFLVPANEAIAGIDVPGEAPNSPIIETLRTLVTLKDFTPDTPRRRLEIFSDLLQKSPLYSQYQDPKKLPEYAALRGTKLGNDIKLTLPDVAVRVDFLPRKRDASFQTEGQMRFWRQLLKDAGAIVDVVVVPDLDNGLEARKPAPLPIVRVTSPAAASSTPLHPTIEGTISGGKVETLWICVTPVGQDTWVQEKARVNGNHWAAYNVNVGEIQNGVGEDFLISAVLNPSVPLHRGMRLSSIDEARGQAVSNIVKVTRR